MSFDLENISPACAAELLAYAALRPPRPSLRSFIEERARVSWSAASKASAASNFMALLSQQDAAIEATRTLADVADGSFVGRMRRVIEDMMIGLDDPTKARSLVLTAKALDDLERETPDTSVSSLDPIVRAVTRMLCSGLPTPNHEGDFSRLTHEQLRALLWMLERVRGNDAVYEQPETIAPGHPGFLEPNLSLLNTETRNEVSK